VKRLSCHISQEACPFSIRFAEPAGEPGYAARGPGERPVGVEAEASPSPGNISHETSSRLSGAPLHPGTDAPSLVALLDMALDPEAWEAFSRGSAIRRAGRAGFARNVSVALGNWGSAEAVPVLTRALGDSEPLVRGQAAWALGRVGGAAASELLSLAASSEEEAWVLEQLDAARR
jgi:epoxyqueuosine reductase QueG